MPRAQKNNRRYYLHQRLKRIVRVDSHNRTMFYCENILDQLTDRQVRYFVELQMKFNYTAQQEII